MRNYIKDKITRVKARYIGKGPYLAVISVIQFTRRCLFNSILLVSTVTTSIIMFLKFDTKYNMYTGTYNSLLSTTALDLSLIFLWLITFYMLTRLIEWLYDEYTRMKRNLFYER